MIDPGRKWLLYFVMTDGCGLSSHLLEILCLLAALFSTLGMASECGSSYSLNTGPAVKFIYSPIPSSSNCFCTWTIRTGSQYFIRLKIISIGLKRSPACKNARLSISDGDVESFRSLATICSPRYENRSFVSSRRTMLLSFFANSSAVGTGVKLGYKRVPLTPPTALSTSTTWRPTTSTKGHWNSTASTSFIDARDGILIGVGIFILIGLLFIAFGYPCLRKRYCMRNESHTECETDFNRGATSTSGGVSAQPAASIAFVSDHSVDAFFLYRVSSRSDVRDETSPIGLSSFPDPPPAYEDVVSLSEGIERSVSRAGRESPDAPPPYSEIMRNGQHVARPNN